MLGPARNEDVRGLVVEAVVALELRTGGGAQLPNAGNLGVLRLAAAHGLDRRVLHALGCVEVRLAGAEGDHVDAAALELLGFGLDGERGGRCERGEALGEHRAQFLPGVTGYFWGYFAASRFSTPGGTIPVTDAP